MSDLNPYAPVRSTDDGKPPVPTDTDRCLIFDGEITRDDFAALMPQRRHVGLLGCIVWGIFLPVVGIAVVFNGVSLANGSLDLESLSVLGLTVLVFFGFIFATQFVSTRRRCDRVLAKRPDLLGPAKGTMDRDGMLFQDAIRTHFFGPSFCVESHFSREGVRMPLGEGEYISLSLRRRLFEPYGTDDVALLMKCWHADSQAAIAPADRMKTICDRLGNKPGDAIEFTGEVSYEIPVDTAENRRVANQNILICSILLALSIACFATRSFGWGTILLLIGGSSLVNAVHARRFAGKPPQPVAWDQQGWISDEHLVWVNAFYGMRMPMTELGPAFVQDDILYWPMKNGSHLMVPKDNFANENDWDRLAAGSFAVPGGRSQQADEV